MIGVDDSDYGPSTESSGKPVEEQGYYTPTIEEFHVGFEFEVKSGNIGKWEPETFTEEHLKYGFPSIHESYRVPYLTPEQITAQGWSTPTPYSNRLAFHNRKNVLIFDPKNMLVAITDGGKPLPKDGEFHVVNYLFNGKIRNLSELKRILKMVL